MKLKQINLVVFKKLSNEFQTYREDGVTGGVHCAIYYQGKLVYYNKFGFSYFSKKFSIIHFYIFMKKKNYSENHK